MINSDTLLTEDNFFLEIEECYKMYHFAVLGSDILYSHDNPMKNQLDNYIAIVEEIKKVKNNNSYTKNSSCQLYLPHIKATIC